MSKLTTILWDLDSTLLDPTIPQRISVRKCFEHFGLGQCSEEQLDMYSVINNRLWVFLNDGSMTKEQITVGRFTEFLKYCGKDYTIAEEFNRYYTEKMGEVVYPCPNAIETVSSLKGKVRQYLVTNGMYHAQFLKTCKAGLDTLLDDLFISETVGFDKPQREYFDIIIEKLGIRDRNTIMIVGDSLITDMQGGNNAGIVTCWYNPNHIENNTDLRIDYEISDLAAIPCIIDGNNRK